MGAHDEGSLEGRGDEELLPNRGDPFSTRGSKDSVEGDPLSDIYPIGQERGSDRRLKAEERRGASRTRPREDGGMRAVGPPLPEDLYAEEMPPTKVEPKLPPSKEFEREPRFSTLEGSGSESANDSLPPFLRPKGEDLEAGSESILVSDIRINWLRQRAEQLEVRIRQEIENPALKKLLSEQLSIARDENIKNRKQFDEAERVLNEVENRINLARRVRAWSASIRMRLTLLEIAFAMLIIIGLIFLPDTLQSSAPHFLPDRAMGMLSSLGVLINNMLWGGLGGVFSALVGLQTHKVLEEDVDRNWAIWYLATPFMGIVLGAFLFLTLRTVLLLLFPSIAGGLPMAWLLYLLSWILGFQQNIAYDMVERGLNVFSRRQGS